MAGSCTIGSCFGQETLLRGPSSAHLTMSVLLTGALLASVEECLLAALVGVSLRVSTFPGHLHVSREGPAQGFSPFSNPFAFLFHLWESFLCSGYESVICHVHHHIPSRLAAAKLVIFILTVLCLCAVREVFVEDVLLCVPATQKAEV